MWYTKYNKERKKEVHTMEAIIALAIIVGFITLVIVYAWVTNKIIGGLPPNSGGNYR